MKSLAPPGPGGSVKITDGKQTLHRVPERLDVSQTLNPGLRAANQHPDTDIELYETFPPETGTCEDHRAIDVYEDWFLNDAVLTLTVATNPPIGGKTTAHQIENAMICNLTRSNFTTYDCTECGRSHDSLTLDLQAAGGFNQVSVEESDLELTAVYEADGSQSLFWRAYTSTREDAR